MVKDLTSIFLNFRKEMTFDSVSTIEINKKFGGERLVILPVILNNAKTDIKAISKAVILQIKTYYYL